MINGPTCVNCGWAHCYCPNRDVKSAPLTEEELAAFERFLIDRGRNSVDGRLVKLGFRLIGEHRALSEAK